MMGRYLTSSVDPTITLFGLHQQAREVWNNLPQDSIRYLSNYAYARVNDCANAKDDIQCIRIGSE